MENSEIQEPIQMTIAKAEIQECLDQLADDDNQETIDELLEALLITAYLPSSLALASFATR